LLIETMQKETDLGYRAFKNGPSRARSKV
jgi:hypothetical protein